MFVMERGDDERNRVAGSQERLVVMSLSSTSNRHQKGWLKMEREKKRKGLPVVLMCCRRWLGRKSLVKCCRHCCSWLPLMASLWWLLCSDGGLQQRTRKKKDKGRGKKRVI